MKEQVEQQTISTLDNPDRLSSYIALLDTHINNTFTGFQEAIKMPMTREELIQLYPELECVQNFSNMFEVKAAITGSVAAHAEWDLMTSSDPADVALYGAFIEQYSAYIQPQVAQETNEYPISRRKFVSYGLGTAGAVFAALFNPFSRSAIYAQEPNIAPVQPQQTPPPPGQEAILSSDVLTQTTQNPIDSEQEDGTAENRESENHNPDYISKWDSITAGAVSGYFFRLLYMQAKSGVVPEGKISEAELKLLYGTENQAEAGINGWTAGSMAAIWNVRRAILKYDSEHNTNPQERIASQHAYEHEGEELSNLPIAAALVAASEATSKISYERREGHLVQAREVLETLFSDYPKKEISICEVTITREDLETFIANGNENAEVSILTDEEIDDLTRPETQKTPLMNKLANTVVDFIDTQKVRIAVEEAEAHLKDDDGKEKMKNEMQRLKGKISSDVLKMGYMSNIFAPFSLTFTTASIANGSMRAIATNMTKLYYFESLSQERDMLSQERKDELWDAANEITRSKLNGKLGLINLAITHASNMAGAALFGDPPNIFFAIQHGSQEWLHNSVEGFMWSNAFSIMAYNTYLKKEGLTGQNGSAILANMTGALDSMKILANTAFKIAQPVWANKLTKISEQLPPFARGRLSIDTKSIVSNFGGKVNEILFGDEFKRLFDFLETIREEPEKAKGDDSVTRNLKEMLNGVMEQRGNDSNIVNEELMNEVNSAGMKFQQEVIAELDRLSLEELNDPERIDSICMKYSHGSEDVNNMLHQMISGYISGRHHSQGAEELDHGEFEHHGEHALSHQARDVRNALGTQLWAVGSLQVITKKSLGLDKEGKLDKNTAKAYTSMILGIIGATSAVADNVAAMLFGIDVLEKIGVKTLGEQFDEQSILAKKLRKYAFLMSVFAGALSKIGNGPNMSIEKFKQIFWDRKQNILIPEMTSNMLAESFGNLWAYSAVGSLLAVASHDLWGEIDAS